MLFGNLPTSYLKSCINFVGNLAKRTANGQKACCKRYNVGPLTWVSNLNWNVIKQIRYRLAVVSSTDGLDSISDE